MKNIFTLLKGFYYILGNRLYILFSLMIMAVFFQGMGIGMILPVIQGPDTPNEINKYFKSTFNFLGLEYSLVNLLIALFIIVLLRTVFMVSQKTYSAKVMTDILVEFRGNLSEEIFCMKYKDFLDKSLGYLNHVLFTECSKVMTAFRYTNQLTVTILFIIVYITIPLLLNPLLFVAILIIGLIMLPIIIKLNVKTKSYSLGITEHSAGLQQMLIQSLNFFKYLKATSEHPKTLKHIHWQNRKLGSLLFKQGMLASISQYGFDPVIALVIIGVIYYYSHIRNENILEHCFMIFLLAKAMQGALSVQAGYRKILGTWGGINSVKKLQKQLEVCRETFPDDSDFQSSYLDGPLRFKNVSFAYDDSLDVLKNISLEIKPDSTVAIVGESGAGKSTIINLIAGLIKPSSGKITISDIDFEKINKQQYRGCIGYITQENIIFNDTLYNNITLWDIENKEEKIKRVEEIIKQVHLEDFVKNLSNSYESILGDHGIMISGGQRQRICIARELYKNSRLLIFDEATSSLDSHTEKEIQRNIDDFKGKKTIIIIAHRLATIKNCDKICVLKAGELVQQGKFQELYDSNGEFRRMVDMQNIV